MPSRRNTKAKSPASRRGVRSSLIAWLKAFCSSIRTIASDIRGQTIIKALRLPELVSFEARLRKHEALDAIERLGDEATTISRQLNEEPQLKPYVYIPRMSELALTMLRESLECFVHRDPARARAIIPRDKEVDALTNNSTASLPAS